MGVLPRRLPVMRTSYEKCGCYHTELHSYVYMCVFRSPFSAMSALAFMNSAPGRGDRCKEIILQALLPLGLKVYAQAPKMNVKFIKILHLDVTLAITTTEKRDFVSACKAIGASASRYEWQRAAAGLTQYASILWIHSWLWSRCVELA